MGFMSALLPLAPAWQQAQGVPGEGEVGTAWEEVPLRRFGPETLQGKEFSRSDGEATGVFLANGSWPRSWPLGRAAS